MKIGWLSTGRDPAARNLLAETVQRAAADGIGLRIGAVFSDRAPGESHESDLLHRLVAELGFPLVTLSSIESWARARADGVSREEWRERFHNEVMDLLAPYGLDVFVLAGYMLIVSPAMCTRRAMLNLHPSLPGGPVGTWQEVIWQLLADDATETGAMIHLVTPRLDRGPVVSVDRFSIRDAEFEPLWSAFREKVTTRSLTDVMIEEGEAEPLFAAVRRRGEAREIPLLYRTLKQFVTGRFIASGCSVEGQGVELPLDLTAEVDAELEARA